MALLGRLYSLETMQTNMFSDVEEGKWYYDYVLSANKKGWVKGDGKGHFNPEAGITKAEGITVLMRVIDRSASNIDVSWEIPEDIFGDYGKWYYGYIMHAIYGK